MLTTAEQQFWFADRIRHDEGDVDAIFLLNNRGIRSEVLGIYVVNGNVVFEEQCDSWYSVELTKTQAIAALKQAIEWIEKQGDPSC